MSLVFNEQTKLLATALNTAAGSCFTVGIATPLAGYIYNVGNMQATLTLGTLLFGLTGWLTAAVLLHSIASASEAHAMNAYWILAFVVTPAIVVLLGYTAMVLHGREADRLERERKGADRG